MGDDPLSSSRETARGGGLTAVSTYAARDRLLRRLGWASYAEYLRSPTWRVIRAAVLEFRPGCALCGAPAEAVHHHAYTAENLTGESAAGLFPLCAAHHHACEFGTGGKLPLAEVRARFNRLFVARKVKERRRR